MWIHACWMAFMAALSYTAQAATPNILLITVDTLRADHLSCYGYSWKTSPNIDRLAAEGVRFERAYSPIPLTGPAHLSLFTSRYPQETGARRNGEAIASERTLVVLPQLLRANGYRTAAFVSGWPLNSRVTQLNKFFDHYDEQMSRSYQLFNSSRWAEDVTPLAIDWLKKNADGKQPFFLWVHYFDPHSPYDFREHFANLTQVGTAAPAKAADTETRERIRNYDTEIAYTDWHVGKLLATLDGLRVNDSTLIALTSDHGESLGEHGYVGHGRHLYENIVRVPLIFRLPGKANGGKTVAEAVSLLDIAPTITDLTIRANLERARVPLTFLGRSLAPAILQGAQLPERPTYHITFDGKKGFAPKWLSWAWVTSGDNPLRIAYREGARKLIWTPLADNASVFDLSKDPLELHPQRLPKKESASQTEITRLQSWLERTQTAASQQQISKRDLDVLRSLGYIQ